MVSGGNDNSSDDEDDSYHVSNTDHVSGTFLHILYVLTQFAQLL